MHKSRLPISCIIGGPVVETVLDAFRCTNEGFYVALGSSMSLALLVWRGGGLLKRVLYFFGNEPSLGQKISDPTPASLDGGRKQCRRFTYYLPSRSSRDNYSKY